MLKYIVILLDRTSTSYCHADNPYYDSDLMPLQTLKDAIFWAMKENLMIQFVYPNENLPEEYLQLIDSVNHVDIKPTPDGDILVIDGFYTKFDLVDKDVVVRTNFLDLCGDNSSSHNPLLYEVISKVKSLTIVIKDKDKIPVDDMGRYVTVLADLGRYIYELMKKGHNPNINILTNRLVLDKMNNCNAGWETITVAPNGKFYICPAFYYSDENDNVGSLSEGLDIKNPHLYRLSHAPICRNCDAYQCHRCIWLNRKTTYEVNTPGHEQCVMAHIERNASRDLLNSVRKHGDFLIGKDIPEIDYLDPFEKIVNK